MKNTPESKIKHDFEQLPSWIKTRVLLLGFDKEWIHKPIPALKNKSVFEAYYENNHEMIMRVFAKNADFKGNENPILYNFTEEERNLLGI